MNTQKIIFLLPPSEGKHSESFFDTEELSFELEKPVEILENATEKDLKCKEKRFAEAQLLNTSIDSQQTTEAIKRYSGVMYSAIDYGNMNESGQKFFEEKFLILSGLYGILTPLDKIANYKLPVEAKGLYQYWWEIIPEQLHLLQADIIVNLLPLSYQKLLGLGTNCSKHKKKLEKILSNENTTIVNINFLKPDGKKISHGVKKIKGAWIKSICEKNITNFEQFGGEVVKNDENSQIVDVNVKVG